MINQAAQTEPIMVVGNMKINLTESEENEFHKLTKTLFQNTEALDKPTVYTCSENIHSKGEFVWNEIWISKTALDSIWHPITFKIGGPGSNLALESRSMWSMSKCQIPKQFKDNPSFKDLSGAQNLKWLEDALLKLR